MKEFLEQKLNSIIKDAANYGIIIKQFELNTDCFNLLFGKQHYDSNKVIFVSLWGHVEILKKD